MEDEGDREVEGVEEEGGGESREGGDYFRFVRCSIGMVSLFTFFREIERKGKHGRRIDREKGSTHQEGRKQRLERKQNEAKRNNTKTRQSKDPKRVVDLSLLTSFLFLPAHHQLSPSTP